MARRTASELSHRRNVGRAYRRRKQTLRRRHRTQGITKSGRGVRTRSEARSTTRRHPRRSGLFPKVVKGTAKAARKHKTKAPKRTVGEVAKTRSRRRSIPKPVRARLSPAERRVVTRAAAQAPRVRDVRGKVSVRSSPVESAVEAVRAPFRQKSEIASTFYYGGRKDPSPVEVALATVGQLPALKAGTAASRISGVARSAQKASKSARKATHTTTPAKRAATAGRGGRAAKPRRAPRPAGKPRKPPRRARYGRSSGTTGRATRRPTQKAKPSARTPKRAVKGRSRRKIERGLTRKPRRQTGRRAAQIGGAGTSSLAAADIAALTRGEDPEALEKAGRGAYEIGRLAVTEPGASARTVKETILGVPQALYEVGAAGVEAAQGDTKRAGKLVDQVTKDYERRYGPLVEGDYEKFRKRGKQTGITPFLLDALIVGPPASRVAGAAARKGALGRGAKRVAGGKRPKLRVAPGKVVEQERSRGLAGAAVQEVRDRARRRAAEKRAAAAPEENRRRIVEPEDAEEVVRLRRGRNLGGAGRDQVTDVAGRKGRAYQRMTSEQAQIGRRFGPRVAKLSGDQRQALKFALQFGVRDAKSARRVADQRIEQIRSARGEEDIPRSIDEIPALEAIARNADDIFTPQFGKLASDLRRAEKRYAVGDPVRGRHRPRDPALNTEQATLRRYRQQADLLGIRRAEGESSASFIARVRREAREQGLDEAGYVTSEMPRGARQFADYALGGFRAAARPKRYTGRTFEAGVESTDPEVITRGLARNVKRRNQWEFVADTFDTYTPRWGRNRTIPELVKELNRRGIAEDQVAFWNPAMFRERSAEALRRADDDAAKGREVPDDIFDDADLHDAVADATLRGDAAADLSRAIRNGDVDPTEFRQTRGWSIVPRDAFSELEATTRPSGPIARSFDVAIQKSSRVLLGVNPPWMVSQPISNAALAGLARTGPTTWVKANLWYRKQPPAVRRDVDAFIGGGPFSDNYRTTRLGASASKLPAGARQLVNGYRGFKETVFGKSIFGGRAQVREANPLDLTFRADNAQNNFFRRAVLYKELNRRLYRDMGKQVSTAGRLQARLANTFKLDPDRQIAALARNPRILEDHARAVRDYLGDYTSYTARERRVFKRSVMFYGYLRFATRFAFYTMPVKHPVMTGLMGNLARLQIEELKEIFGGDVLPFALGRIYFDNGKLVSDFSNVNPLSSALIESQGVRQAFGVFPPYIQVLASQAASKNIYTGRPWQTEGNPQARIYTDYGLEERSRVIAHDMLSLAFPYRLWEETEQQGARHGADTLAWDPRPLEYVEGESKELNERRKREFRKRGGAGEILRQEIFPTIPQPAEGLVEVNRRIRAAQREEERARRKKRGGGSSSTSSGTTSGFPSLGGSSSGSSSSSTSSGFPSLLGGG